MKMDERWPLKGPVFAHDCDECVYLGHYEGHDLYLCPKEVSGCTVIARWSGEPSHYASGMPFGEMPLGTFGGTHSRYLRVAQLLAADLGHLPFVWSGTKFWPEKCVAPSNTIVDIEERNEEQSSAKTR